LSGFTNEHENSKFPPTPVSLQLTPQAGAILPVWSDQMHVLKGVKVLSVFQLAWRLWTYRYVVGESGYSDGDVIWIPTSEEVTDPDAMERLANVVAGLGLARRRLPDWIADQILLHDGTIMDRETGSPREFGDEEIDVAFNDDGSFRWLSDFVKMAVQKPKQRGQLRTAPRLKLLHVAVEIGNRQRTDGVMPNVRNNAGHQGW